MSTTSRSTPDTAVFTSFPERSSGAGIAAEGGVARHGHGRGRGVVLGNFLMRAWPGPRRNASGGYAAWDGRGVVLGLLVGPPAAVVGVPGFVRMGVVSGICLLERVRLRMPKESARVGERRIGHLPTRARPIADAEGERSGSTVDEVILGLRASMAAGSDSCEDQQGPSRAIKGKQGGGLGLM